MDNEEIINPELDKVMYVSKKERKNETFTTALAHRLREMETIGETGYTREIVISVPQQLIEEDNVEAKSFISTAGKINRDSNAGMEISLETISDNDVIIHDVVFKIKDIEKIPYVINKYLEE